MGVFCWKKCQENRLKKKQIKATKKVNKVKARQAGRTERTGIKQSAKTERTGTKQETKQVAYMNGINPTAPMWSAFSSLGASASRVLGGGGLGTGGINQAIDDTDNRQMLIYGALGLGLVLMLKK